MQHQFKLIKQNRGEINLDAGIPNPPKLSVSVTTRNKARTYVSQDTKPGFHLLIGWDSALWLAEIRISLKIILRKIWQRFMLTKMTVLHQYSIYLTSQTKSQSFIDLNQPWSKSMLNLIQNASKKIIVDELIKNGSCGRSGFIIRSPGPKYSRTNRSLDKSLKDTTWMVWRNHGRDKWLPKLVWF